MGAKGSVGCGIRHDSSPLRPRIGPALRARCPGMTKSCGLAPPRKRGRSSGEGAGQPGLARLLVLLPLRRDSLPRAAVFHTPSDWRPCVRAFDGSPRPPCDDRNGTALPPQLRGHLTAPQGARRASGQDPSPPDEDPRTLRRPGFIARPQPADIENVDPTPSPPTGCPYPKPPPPWGGFRTLTPGQIVGISMGWLLKV